ncbi:hypothetical protein [Pseudomonas sp. NPDC089569]|uniref:hypothetical protein n=1 Tax=Pseudomonas sp. NPDC089569 TaxID=3390722 RepID=UPI003CFBD6C7
MSYARAISIVVLMSASIAGRADTDDYPEPASFARVRSEEVDQNGSDPASAVQPDERFDDFMTLDKAALNLGKFKAMESEGMSVDPGMQFKIPLESAVFKFGDADLKKNNASGFVVF